MNRLVHGDCLEVLKGVDSASVGMVLADLPYGVTNIKWDVAIPMEPLWAEIKRVLRPGGACLMFAQQPFSSALVMSNPTWYRHQMVWAKNTITDFVNANIRPLRNHEEVLVFGAKKVTYNPQGLVPCGKSINHTRKHDRIQGISLHQTYGLKSVDGVKAPQKFTNYPRSIITGFKSVPGTKRLHATQKPLDLLEYLIRTFSNEGDVVLDPTCGSGSALEAARNCGRGFIGIEMDEKYYKVSKERLGL